jgi:hypothetical protein
MRIQGLTVYTVTVVPENGVEPSRPCGHRILSPARLPVPPLGHSKRIASPEHFIQRFYHSLVRSNYVCAHSDFTLQCWACRYRERIAR